MDLPTSEISTKRVKLSGEEAKEQAEEEQSGTEEKIWAEPLKRVSPPVCSAVVLPDDVVCPDACERLGSAEELNPHSLILKWILLLFYNVSIILNQTYICFIFLFLKEGFP